MRDAFGEIDPDEIDIIDFIEPDPAAFALSAGASDQGTGTGSRPRWLIPAAITSVVAIAVGLFAWSPWSNDETAAFPAGDAPALTLTGELVFDDPPAELTVASVGAVSADDGLFDLGDAAGYFFAEDGARWLFTDGASGGRWAGFFAVSEALGIVTMDAGAEATTATVQGAPALIDAQTGDVRAVRFGPVDGRIFSVVTGGMSVAETLAFAEATGVNDGVPTLSNDNVLGAMRPIGDMADYQTTIATMFAALSAFGAQPDIVSLHYGDNAFNIGDATPQYSLATQPTSGDTTLEMLRFMAGGVDGPAVHGQPSIVAEEVALGFGASSNPSSLAAWVEGGRLIVVTGPHELEATLALAESVRPATDNEWAQVVEIARNSVDPSIPLFPDVPSSAVALYKTFDQASGDTTTLTVELVDAQLSVCIEKETDSGSAASCNAFLLELPILTTRTSDDSSEQYVIAIIDRGVGDAEAELRITLADGSTDIHPLQDRWPELPGPAVATLLPEDHGAVELWIGAKLVKTLTV